jgi:branched-chain amino acid transport system ATP-binding protein
MARALACSPDLLLLDEPSSGLNAEETHALGQVLVQLAGEGMGILLVEHDMELVMSICDRVDVLDNGMIICRGDPDSVRADPQVQQAYLGGEAEPVEPDAPVIAATPASSNGSRETDDDGNTVLRLPDGPDEPGTGIPPALSVNEVRAGYGRIEVLHGVSLEVRTGSALALLGPNGAGKSTLLKVIAGQLAPTTGTVEFSGRTMGRNASEHLARTGVCMIPEGRAVFPNLTVRENLLMYTYRRPGLKAATIEEKAFARFPVLGMRHKQLAGTLSGGEQRMLAMARALTTDPEILFLDELSMGLAPLIVEELYGVVDQLVKAEHLTIVMVEQFVQTALSIADHAVIMVNGRLVRSGSPESIRAEVVGAYLGAEIEPDAPSGGAEAGRPGAIA